jgi:hypothetical protein
VAEGCEQRDEVPDLPPRLAAKSDQREQLPRRGREVLDPPVDHRRVSQGRDGAFQELAERRVEPGLE